MSAASSPQCRHLARYAGVLGCPECCDSPNLAEHLQDGEHIGRHILRAHASDVGHWRRVFERKAERAPNVLARAYALGCLSVIGGTA
jgi:hypothetical protein